MARNDQRGISWGGIALIVIGTIFLLENFDLIRLRDVLRFWPLVLIAVGARLVLDSRQRGGGSSGGNRTDVQAPPPPPASP